MDIKTFLDCYPKLYHMAERKTWPSIKMHGLLSTTATLDFLEIREPERSRYESEHRPLKVILTGKGNEITLRDQKPMPTNRLLQALQEPTTPTDWYRIINRKVFFWATRERLLRLLGAREYRSFEHDVITIDSRSFVDRYEENIELCHMNSGNTFPIPHRRSPGIFWPISTYPTRKNGKPLKPVAELVVDYAVPDLSNYVTEVWRMRGGEVLRKIE